MSSCRSWWTKTEIELPKTSVKKHFGYEPFYMTYTYTKPWMIERMDGGTDSGWRKKNYYKHWILLERNIQRRIDWWRKQKEKEKEKEKRLTNFSMLLTALPCNQPYTSSFWWTPVYFLHVLFSSVLYSAWILPFTFCSFAQSLLFLQFYFVCIVCVCFCFCFCVVHHAYYIVSEVKAAAKLFLNRRNGLMLLTYIACFPSFFLPFRNSPFWFCLLFEFVKY